MAFKICRNTFPARALPRTPLGSSRPIVGWRGDTILPLRRSPLTLGAIGASVWRGDDPPNISPIEQRVMEHLTLLILYYKVTLLQSGKSAGYAAGYDK